MQSKASCIFLEPYFGIYRVFFMLWGSTKIVLVSLHSIVELLVQGGPFLHNCGLFNIWLFDI